MAEEQAAAAPVKDRYRFEIKAWIPVPEVVDPEQPVREAGAVIEAAARLARLVSYVTEYHGDGHAGYEGDYRVSTAIEFDWDGQTMSNAQIVQMSNFGQTIRRFAVTTEEGFPAKTHVERGEERKTAKSEVHGGLDHPNQVSLGMSSANPVIMTMSPDIDADYMLFMSQDEIGGHTEATVLWTTDLMPNHGFRVTKNDRVVAEKVVNEVQTRGIDLDSATGAVAILAWLSSKTNGGAHRFQP